MTLYKLLILDLKEKKKKIEYIDKQVSDFYMGGISLCLYWINKNKQVKDFWAIFTSALINYKNPISKYIICAGKNSKIKSYASIGGDFSYFLKSNSYDALILLNKADKIYDLYIDGTDIKFNKISNDNSNNDTFTYLKNTYGNDTSSIYITSSTKRGDKLSRLIVDKYRGCSRNLSNFLYEKNLRSITIGKNKLKSIYLNLYKKSSSPCEGCFISCKSRSKKEESSNLFSKKDSYLKGDLNKLKEIKERLNQYGIDIFGLSKSIEFSFNHLNHIYNFKDLSLNSLDNIVKKVTSDRRDKLYADLSSGREFLKDKYGIKTLEKMKKTDNYSYNKKIIDSICICLFAVNINDIEDIVETINIVSMKNFKEDNIYSLIAEIKKMDAYYKI